MKLDEFKLLDTDKKLEEVFKSVEKTRKYFKVTLIVSVAMIVLPLLILPFLVSDLLGTYESISALGF